MKISRLNRLDLEDLNNTEKELEKTLAKLKDVIDNPSTRYQQIKNELDDIKKIIGKDERLTEIYYSKAIDQLATADQPAIKKEYCVYTDGLHSNFEGTANIDNNLVDVVFAYGPNEIMTFHKDGTMSPIQNEIDHVVINASVVDSKKNKLVSVTKNGNVKVSNVGDNKLSKVNEKVMKIKDDDELIYAAFCDDNDFIMLFDGQEHILKLAIKDLPVATKLTVGVKSGFATVSQATLVKDTELLLFVTKDCKGKYTPVKDFSVDNKGNKGQLIAENTWIMRKFDDGRENIYIVPKQGKVILVPKSKITIKSRSAIGALLTNRVVVNCK